MQCPFVHKINIAPVQEILYYDEDWACLYFACHIRSVWQRHS